MWFLVIMSVKIILMYHLYSYNNVDFEIVSEDKL